MTARDAIRGALAEAEAWAALVGARHSLVLAEIVSESGARLATMTAAELAARGLSRSAAARVAAAGELARASRAARRRKGRAVLDHLGALAVLLPYFEGRECERFVVLLLDAKGCPGGVHVVSEGTLNSSLVHPREVFAPAVRERACSVVVAHNHPSGDPEPSADDIAVTKRLVQAGDILGIPLQDHIVLGDGGRCVSLRAVGKMGGAA